ncbi:MAG: RecQ family ATP-dependent DNA helicase [Trichodesmium sp. MAG_R04]|nr:RecQ family ATP-dependent DNA helicase [Trichodesmium sp. MAG_R04]
MKNSEQTSWNTVKETFKKIWGYDNFRPPQGEIINCLLTGKDALIIMPTGGGKSICFQLPALLKTGLTLVISPLVALMENQVQELSDRSLPATLLHSQLNPQKKRETLQKLEQNKLRLLYLSPETLFNKKIWNLLSQPQIKINGLILDEAHCLVQWGEIFRPAYRRLGAVRPALMKSKPPGTNIAIAAFTATADPQAQKIIKTTLQLQNPTPFLLNPYRNNLHLKIQHICTPKSRRQQLFKFIRNREKQVGLVYVRTRKDSENLAEILREKNYQTIAYHAGLSSKERRHIEKAWIGGEINFVVCTSAFGMGINKPDVRWVIHFQAPSLLSEYIQEIGRGGRDGKLAEALTLISEPTGWLDPEDKQRQKFLAEKLKSQYQTAQKLIKQLPTTGNIDSLIDEFPHAAIALSILHSSGKLRWYDPFNYIIDNSGSDKTVSLNYNSRIKDMNKYLSTRKCRWQFLLEAFGFSQQPQNMHCGHCDNCLKEERRKK